MNDYSAWPELEYESWKETCQTLHRWIQIVGKIRLAKTPRTNHSWSSTLYVTERGLTTSVIHDKRYSFSLELDFVDHLLQMRRSDGEEVAIPLVQEAVSSFYSRCMKTLAALGMEPHFQAAPNEVADATPFALDHAHRTYDPAAAHRFWRALLKSDQAMKDFRSRFVGKCSPVHFFWGSMDLAVTRFSGRRAPEHPGGVLQLCVSCASGLRGCPRAAGGMLRAQAPGVRAAVRSRAQVGGARGTLERVLP